MFHTTPHSACGHCQPRRSIVLGLLLATAVKVSPSCATTSKDAPLPADAKRALVDVHHHVWAPAFLKELESRKLTESPARN